MTAQRADDGRIISVVNGDGVSQEMPEGDMMPAIELEFSAFEGFNNSFQNLRILVGSLLFFRHDWRSFLENKKAPEDYSQGADLLCCGVDELQVYD
jgi:hypothetical protein